MGQNAETLLLQTKMPIWTCTNFKRKNSTD